MYNHRQDISYFSSIAKLNKYKPKKENHHGCKYHQSRTAEPQVLQVLR